jgi:hypothetical protein
MSHRKRSEVTEDSAPALDWVSGKPNTTARGWASSHISLGHVVPVGGSGVSEEVRAIGQGRARDSALAPDWVSGKPNTTAGVWASSHVPLGHVVPVDVSKEVRMISQGRARDSASAPDWVSGKPNTTAGGWASSLLAM